MEEERAELTGAVPAEPGPVHRQDSAHDMARLSDADRSLSPPQRRTSITSESTQHSRG